MTAQILVVLATPVIVIAIAMLYSLKRGAKHRPEYDRIP